MATIENRGHCQFRAKIRNRGHKTITKTFNNRRDAEAWARSVEAEFDRKGFLPSLVAHRMTFRQAGERYREEVFPRLANKGKTENARHLRLIDKFGELTLASFDSSHVAQFRDLRLKEGASPQTVKHEIGLLGRILKQCVIDWGIPFPRVLPLPRSANRLCRLDGIGGFEPERKRDCSKRPGHQNAGRSRALSSLLLRQRQGGVRLRQCGWRISI